MIACVNWQVRCERTERLPAHKLCQKADKCCAKREPTALGFTPPAVAVFKFRRVYG